MLKRGVAGLLERIFLAGSLLAAGCATDRSGTYDHELHKRIAAEMGSKRDYEPERENSSPPPRKEAYFDPISGIVFSCKGEYMAWTVANSQVPKIIFGKGKADRNGDGYINGPEEMEISEDSYGVYKIGDKIYALSTEEYNDVAVKSITVESREGDVLSLAESSDYRKFIKPGSVTLAEFDTSEYPSGEYVVISRDQHGGILARKRVYVVNPERHELLVQMRKEKIADLKKITNLQSERDYTARIRAKEMEMLKKKVAAMERQRSMDLEERRVAAMERRAEAAEKAAMEMEAANGLEIMLDLKNDPRSWGKRYRRSIGLD